MQQCLDDPHGNDSHLKPGTGGANASSLSARDTDALDSCIIAARDGNTASKSSRGTSMDLLETLLLLILKSY